MNAILAGDHIRLESMDHRGQDGILPIHPAISPFPTIPTANAIGSRSQPRRSAPVAFLRMIDANWGSFVIHIGAVNDAQ